MEEPIIISPETKYIAIEGTVGSGKTSLAKKMENHLDGKLILEQPETNPFLESFYKDPRSNALPTELSFLFQRSKLLDDINQDDLFTSISITDFIFDKDNIFTEINPFWLKLGQVAVLVCTTSLQSVVTNGQV